MGIDGRLLMGEGVMINPFYLSDDQIDKIGKIVDEYEDIIEFNRMDGISRTNPLLIWSSEPMNLRSGIDRRPLIINNSTQMEEMKPMNYKSIIQDISFMDQNSKKLWEPSYGDFLVKLDDSDENKEEIKEKVIKRILEERFFLVDDNGKQKLNKRYVNLLSDIINNNGYSLAGQWLLYIAD